MTALLALALVLSVCGGIPGAFLLGRRYGRHIQTAAVWAEAEAWGKGLEARRIRAALYRAREEGT